MKKTFLLVLFLVIISATAMAADLSLQVNPTTVTPNSDIKLMVKSSGIPDGKWAVAYDILLSGGCTRAGKTTISGFMLNDVGEDKTDEYTIKSPSTDGLCKFDVTYEFTGDTEKKSTVTATIKTPAPVTPPSQTIQPIPEPVSVQQESVPEPAQIESNNYTGWIIMIGIALVGFILFWFMKKKEEKKPLKKVHEKKKH
ncbi:MAG: LPXTG cell wall anchor domain-containing protein [Nanoarchaeota archaeon]